MTEPRMRQRKRRHDAALLLPAVGVIALLPPVAGFFTGASAVFWLFGVWFVLIVAAWALSRRLVRED